MWRSPKRWEIDQATWTDINRDSVPELAMIVWRPYRPWYVDRYLPHAGRTAGFHDGEGRSCHLIFVGWKKGAFREIWAGSALADPVVAFSSFDVTGNGIDDLVTLEAHYDVHKHGTVHSMGIWEWNGFGFSLVERYQNAVLGMGLLTDATW